MGSDSRWDGFPLCCFFMSLLTLQGGISISSAMMIVPEQLMIVPDYR